MGKIFKTIKSADGKKEYDVMVVLSEGELDKYQSNCTCKWGIYRWRKSNESNNVCKHIKKALEIWDNEQKERFIEKMNRKI